MGKPEGLAAAAAVLALLLAGCGRAAPAGAGGPPAPPQPKGRVEHVLVVSVDGLMPEAYLDPDAHGLKVPTLRRVRAEGAHSPGLRGVFPTVTYPTHTSMVTGAEPAVHGVFSNTVLDPLGVSRTAWYWYAEAIRVPTLWDVVEGAGGTAAAIFWPVTVGARMRFVVPEYWRTEHPGDNALLRALSTPGLLETVAGGRAEFWAALLPGVPHGEAVTDVAVHLIEKERPTLLLIHLVDLDAAQHEHGPRSPEAFAAIEAADGQIARMLAAIARAGLGDRTLVVVLSDHGFRRIAQRMRPGALLREAGLGPTGVTRDGKPTTWRVGVVPSGGQAYLYLADERDAEAAERARAVFAPLAGAPGSGIARVLDREAIRARGGDPRAFLALESVDGVAFAGGFDGPALSPSGYQGHHGFPEDDPAMAASLLVLGPGVRAGRVIDGARMIDVGPTVAAWLGVALPAATGQPLALD